MGHKYTDEELIGLSDTERAALNEVDEDEDIPFGDEDDEGDALDDDPEEEDTEEETDEIPAGDDKAAEEIVAPDVNTEASITDFDLDSVPAVNFVPKLSGDISEKYEAEIEALGAKLDEGEITAAEHRREVRKAEAASQNEELSSQMWQAEQATFAKSLGFKSIAEFQAKDPAEFGKLNAEVIRVANSAEGKGLTGIQTLFLAKHNLSEAAEIAEARAYLKAKKAGTAPEEKKTVPAKPAAAKPNIQTLRNVPAAEAQDVGTDKFAHLDKLSGMHLERAIAKLSPADYEAYVQGA